MRSAILPALLAAALYLTGCEKARMSTASPGLVLECTAGAPELLRGKIRINSDRSVRYKARVSERWVQVHPSEGTVPAELTVFVDASRLSSDSHLATVTVESPWAERAVEFKVEVKIAKGRLRFRDPVLRMGGALDQERLAMKVPLETHPPGHRFPWRVRVREPWLEVVPEQGRGDVELEVVARLKGFGIGELRDTVTVESDDATNPARLQVFVSVRPAITANPQEIELACEFGSSTPLHARTALSAHGAEGLGFVCTPGEKWIGVSPAYGNLPAHLNISVDPSGKEAGEHHADVLVESPQAEPIALRIGLNVRKPELRFDREDPLEFECHPGDGKELSAVTTVSAGENGEAKVPVEATTSVPWLSVKLDRETTPARLEIQADPSLLPSGEYEGGVVVASVEAEAPVEHEVRLKVRTCRLIVVPGITLRAVAGKTDPTGRIRLETDPPGLRVKWAASWTRRDIFLVEPPDGTGPAEIEIRARIADLPAGSIQDSLKIESRDAGASADCQVSLQIAPTLDVEPATLRAECAVGTSGPVSVPLRVAPVGREKLAFTCRPGAAWVKPVPAHGEAPASVRIELDPLGRSPGTYRSDLVFQSDDYEPVRIPITLKIRKAHLAVSRPKVTLEGFAGFSRPLAETVSVTTDPEGAIEFGTRSNTGWLSCSPETGRTSAEIALRVDGTGLGSGSHRGRITVFSEQAEEAARIDVTLSLKKIRLQAPVETKLIGTTADDRISGRLKLGSDPGDHRVRWKARWTASELELNPSEGEVPAEIEVVVRANGGPAGERRFPVVFESDDAEQPVHSSVNVTLYEAGSPHAEIFPQFHELKLSYGTWVDQLIEVIPRLASEDPIVGVRILEEKLPALQEGAARLQKSLRKFRSAVSGLGERLREEGLEAEARKLSEKARSMEHRVEIHAGEAASVISGARVLTLKIQAEPRWRTTPIRVHSGDVLFVTAKGRWTGSPEWPWKGPSGEPVESGENAQHSLVRTLPFFALLGSIGGGEPVFIGEETFLLVTEEAEGSLRFRPNYQRGEYRGELEIRVLRLRLPWYLRTVFADVLGPLSRERSQYRRAIRHLLRDFLAGKRTAEDLAATKRDLLANYPRLKKALESRPGELRKRLVAERLGEQLAIPE